jgi:hypothetical protein
MSLLQKKGAMIPSLHANHAVVHSSKLYVDDWNVFVGLILVPFLGCMVHWSRLVLSHAPQLPACSPHQVSCSITAQIVIGFRSYFWNLTVDYMHCAKKDFLWRIVWIQNNLFDFVILQTLNALDIFPGNFLSYIFTALLFSGMIMFLWVCLQSRECHKKDFIQVLVFDHKIDWDFSWVMIIRNLHIGTCKLVLVPTP